ncbi:hypothetical protein ACXR0O_09890 [Verrucomicrobiota bacterium sgz303538]
MPALRRGAKTTLIAYAGTGSILWITDSIAPEQVELLKSWRRKSSAPIRLLPPLLPGAELNDLTKNAREIDASVVRLTSYNSDINALARAARFSTATTGELSGRWQESGYWLTPLLAVLLLPFFRRGWMARTAARG